jgi:predicted amino acid dehydrogenase
MKNSFKIAEISFGRSDWNVSYSFDFSGKKFEVHRFGANFSTEIMMKTMAEFRNNVDAFSVIGLPPVIRLHNTSYAHSQYLDVMNMPLSIPVCDGTGLREISNISSLMKFIESGKIQPERGVYFPNAILNSDIEEFIRHRYPNSVYFGDVLSTYNLPLILKPFPGLMKFAKIGAGLSAFRDLKKQLPMSESGISSFSQSIVSRQLANVPYVIADLGVLTLFDRDHRLFKNKDLIVWSHHQKMEDCLSRLEPNQVINLFPEQFKLAPYINYSTLDAAIRLTQGRHAALSSEEWTQILATEPEMIQVARKYTQTRHRSAQIKMGQKIRSLKNQFVQKATPDFAFIVHALSHRDFERIPLVGKVIQSLPDSMNDSVDRFMLNTPTLVYGEIKHIVSEATGKEVNGIIYGLPATPKILKNAPTDLIYSKIEKICYDAASRGAKIIGLGAYTKVVGDSGLTINQNSPIPVTTGNSLSASATLWGLYDVVSRSGLLKVDRQSGRVDGTALVVGATGSIGKVSAKLLALAFKKLILVAPRKDRLIELQIEIQKLAPHCQVEISTEANEIAPLVDVVVTATSAFDQKIMDVMRLKPGCIVCDCSRPLDFTSDDARKRPDVLIIESGELLLPGPYKLTCDLGLPGKTVYACLAETAILSLEGRNESFTLGREIEWNKVKEIYRLSKKHGVKLAETQGHMGIVTDKEISLFCELVKQKKT